MRMTKVAHQRGGFAHYTFPFVFTMAFGQGLRKGWHLLYYLIGIQHFYFLFCLLIAPAQLSAQCENSFYSVGIKPGQPKRYIATHAVTENIHVFVVMLVHPIQHFMRKVLNSEGMMVRRPAAVTRKVEGVYFIFTAERFFQLCKLLL